MKRAALALVLLLVVLGSIGTASAATLAVRGGAVDEFTVTRPCADGATATGANPATTNQTHVRLTIPQACVGRNVQVTVVDAAGVAHSGAASPMNQATLDIPVQGGFTAAAGLTVRATVDGWNLTTTWSWTAPAYIWCTVVTPGSTATCTATIVKRTTDARVPYWDVVVSTTSPTPVRWEVGFDLANSYYGTVTRLGNSDLDGYDDAWPYSWGDAVGNWSAINDVVRQNCGAAPMRVQGLDSAPRWDASNNFREVRAGRERLFSLVVNQTQAGYDDVKRPGTCV